MKIELSYRAAYPKWLLHFFSAADSDTISLSQAEIISSVCFGVFSVARISVSGFWDSCCKSRRIASKE